MPINPTNAYGIAKEPVSASIERSQNKSSGPSIMSFPEDLGNHFIALSFKEYEYGSDTGVITTVNTNGAVVLPLPQALEDSYDVNISQAELGIGGRAAAEFASESASGRSADLGKRIGAAATSSLRDLGSLEGFANSIENGISDFGSLVRFLGRGGVDAILPGAGRGTDVGLGTTVNPHVAVVFDGMNLKNHQFNWTFHPKSQEETNRLSKIQKYIRSSITPSYSSDARAVLEYPSVVDIAFGGIKSDYFYYFKRCMVQNFSMNFTPTGNLSFLRGGAPAAVSMNMSLIETEIRTKEDGIY